MCIFEFLGLLGNVVGRACHDVLGEHLGTVLALLPGHLGGGRQGRDALVHALQQVFELGGSELGGLGQVTQDLSRGPRRERNPIHLPQGTALHVTLQMHRHFKCARKAIQLRRNITISCML